MKQINEQQIQVILDTMTKYDIGVIGYINIQNMLKTLPVVEIKKEPETNSEQLPK